MTELDKSSLQADFNTMASLFNAKYGVSLTLSYVENSREPSFAPAETQNFDRLNTQVAEAVTQKMKTTSSADLYMTAWAPNLKYNKEKGIVGSIFVLPRKRSQYVVTEINPRAPKFCVHVEVIGSGARYKMPLSALAQATFVGHN